MDDKLIEQYLDMFLSPAWAHLRDSLEYDANILNDVSSIEDSDMLYFRKGQLSIIQDITGLEERLRSENLD